MRKLFNLSFNGTQKFVVADEKDEIKLIDFMTAYVLKFGKIISLGYILYIGDAGVDEHEFNVIVENSPEFVTKNLIMKLNANEGRMIDICGFYPTKESKIFWGQATAELFPNLCEENNSED